MLRDSFLIAVSIVLMLQIFCPAQAADESLVLYFPFDEGQGDTAEDHSNFDHDFEHDAVLEGADWVEGKLGKALYFDGGSYAAVMPGQEVSIGEETTWMLWFKTDVEGQGTFLATLHGTMILYLSGGSISAQVWTNPGAALWNTVNSNVRATSGEWYHVAAAWSQDSGEITIYVNGQEANSAVAEGGVSFKSGRQLAIGGNDQITYPGEALFTGVIDEFRIYNRALSGNEIMALMGALAVYPNAKLAVTWGEVKK